MKLWLFSIPLLILGWIRQPQSTTTFFAEDKPLIITKNETDNTLSIFVKGETKPRLVQNAKPDFRPYIHPLVSPDLKSTLTEYSPSHHKHQTGIYWGITRINERDFFHNPQGEYWRRVSFDILTPEGPRVSWQTVYELLDAQGQPLLTEKQTWTVRQEEGKYFMELEWEGKAEQNLTFNKYDYGGLFIRMPWKPQMPGQVINAARQTNLKAEGQKAQWIDVGLQLEGRTDQAHVALFDHPQNRNFPQQWRVDGQMGIGTAKARSGDWQLKQGETELIRHQILVYNEELSDIILTQLWTEYSGKQGLYSTIDLWKLAQEEGKNAKFLTPEESVKSMTVKDGFLVDVWASEPMITQPMAFCWDDRGRLWVAENRDYESRGHGFSNSGDSRILILEDTDGDGKADKKTVFLEGIAFPAALAVGFDGVYIGAPPNLLFVPDKNKDDKADVDAIEIRLTGWGIRDRHETLNSLHWGPDGWLYGLQGFATPSIVGKPLGNGKIYKGNEPFPTDIPLRDSTHINGGVWRYHPTKDKFEVVAHGFSNPWGVDYDKNGELFITACVIPHLWHVIPGGIYHRQGGQHFNPFHYSDIRTIADHSHRSAHGGARIYQSDGFPANEKDKIFMANIHEHAVLSDILSPKGSGFVGKHGDDFLAANNAQWVGFSLEIGPDGAMYVLDWHDADICGSEVLNKETGRIFKVTHGATKPLAWKDRYADLEKLNDLELAKLQTSTSDWHTRRARLVLQNRATKGKISKSATKFLNDLLTTGNAENRLKSLWTLYQTNQVSTENLIKLTADKEVYMRAWAIRLLCEENGDQTKIIETLTSIAKKEYSPIVRKYLAAASQRLKPENRWEIISGLSNFNQDADDHNIPKMLWFSFEPLVSTKSASKALALAAKSEIPLLANYTSRKLADLGQTDQTLTFIQSNSANTLNFLEGIHDALENNTQAKMPSQWQKASAYLKGKEEPISKMVTKIAQKFDDQESTTNLISQLKNKDGSTESQNQAIIQLAGNQKKELIPLLPSLISENGTRKAAIRALASFDQPNLAKTVLDNYQSYSVDQKQETIQTLSSRSSYGNLLTKAIASGAIPKKDVPAYTARQLLRVVGSGFVEVWGPIELQSNTALQEMSKFKGILTTSKLKEANLTNGKMLFQNTCAPCHKLFGKGGDIGPDITGANRGNLDYLLSNIIDPTSDIQDDYKMVIITTRDGRMYSGNIIAENNTQLTLRIVGQEPVRLAKSQIQSRETTSVSLMPPGLLNQLSEKEVVDLIGYLQLLKEK